jgi:pimeloyl-ACP methyl ester carboxylesterase
MPDYRGHNNSEGREFTHGFLATSYYTEDVVALLSGLSSIKNADLDNVFMWGHSLGGEVSLRALLATDIIKGATLWSSVGGEIWDQAYYYERYSDLTAFDSDTTAKISFDQLKKDINGLGVQYDWTTREPLRHLSSLRTPIVIHHAIGDTGADYRWSLRLAKELYLIGQPYNFYSYPGTDHFFQGQQRQDAVDRDVRHFRALMSAERPGAAKSPSLPGRTN